jgi:integrin alpha FG-GAP repeat containing protein 1
LSSNLPFVSTGDVNLDGFPDVLLTCNGRVLLFVNSGCGQGCAHPVSLQQAEIKELDDLRNVTRAVFFDLKDDGTLDILVEQEGGHITALEYVPQDINMFLKVYVPSGSGASSAVLPGSTVVYLTHDRNGQQQVSVGQFWSSSATSFLPLPYVVLGLGLAPNFVEDFVVGVLSEGAANMNRKWTRLVPNSQLKVITNPVSDPSRWKLALYLTPSSLVWITCGVMTGVCILVSVLVLLLQIREKYIDTKERKQANLQFHFDSL